MRASHIKLQSDPDPIPPPIVHIEKGFNPAMATRQLI
jgi:hypothetical protein